MIVLIMGVGGLAHLLQPELFTGFVFAPFPSPQARKREGAAGETLRPLSDQWQMSEGSGPRAPTLAYAAEKSRTS